MIDWKKIMNEVFGEKSTQAKAESDSVEKISISDTKKENTSDDDIKIYTATKAEKDYWGAFSGLVSLQMLLFTNGLTQTLQYGSPFKEGYNDEKHFAALFFDEEHYFKIPFTDTDGEPVDRHFAKKVVQRYKKIKLQA